jgi:hypothetical protein
MALGAAAGNRNKMEDMENVRLPQSIPNISGGIVCNQRTPKLPILNTTDTTIFKILSGISIHQYPAESRERSPDRSQPPPPRKVLGTLAQSTINRKHHLSGLPVPDAKRPTLAQRAGDFSSQNGVAPPSDRPVNQAVATTAAAGLFRFNASASTRTSPPRGRSNTSFSASVGSGVRPQNYTSFTRARPAAAPGRIPRQARPITNNNANESQIMTLKASTTRPDTTAIPNGISTARTLATTGKREGYGQAPMAKGKPISHSFSKPHTATTFKHRNNLDIPRNDARVTSFRSKPIPVSPLPKSIGGLRNSSITSAMQSLSLEVIPPSDAESPSRLPRPVTPAPMLFSTPLSICKPRQKSPSKLKHFLTRDTNTTAWDPDDMLASVERVMSEGFGKLQQNTQESSSMKEVLDMYKANCGSHPKSSQPEVT